MENSYIVLIASFQGVSDSQASGIDLLFIYSLGLFGLGLNLSWIDLMEVCGASLWNEPVLCLSFVFEEGNVSGIWAIQDI